METALRAEVRPAAESLSQLLAPAAVDFATLHGRYGALLELVRRLIGVVPNCDPILEIWPPAFRTYNVMVPNLLNLPFFLWGFGAPKPPVALAMYAASRAAECMYCSAHTCSFALRRGADPARIATLPEDAHPPVERAAIAVGRALAAVPAQLGEDQRAELRRHLSPADAEWVVLAVAMMGFLNKFMDAMGIDLEDATVEEVTEHIGSDGWTPGQHRIVPTDRPAPAARGDSLAFKLGLVRFIPQALALDRRWTAGVPARWPAAGVYLRERTGHDFPVLGKLTHRRAIRAIATMVRDNCTPSDSRLGLAEKHRAGIVYAAVVQNHALLDETRRLATHAGATDLEGALALGFEDADFDDAAAVAHLARTHGPALLLARAASPSPARVTPAVIEHARALEPQAIVELVGWISVLQLLHRLHVWHG